MGLASLIVNVATAEDAVAPPYAAVEGVDFSDPLAQDVFPDSLEFSFSDQDGARFKTLDPGRSASDRDARHVEVSLIARRGDAGLPLDVAFAQRASLTVNDEGDIEREGRGAELRLGRGLPSMRRRETPSWDRPAIYFFAAADDEALTWQPGVRNAFGGSSSTFALQDRVEIGDMQAGVTYEAGGVQASVAYVEREVSYQSGSRNFRQDESFTGVTLTMRH
jgi:hypothetical protein